MGASCVSGSAGVEHNVGMVCFGINRGGNIYGFGKRTRRDAQWAIG